MQAVSLAISSLFISILMLFVMYTGFQAVYASQANLSSTNRETQQQLDERNRTDIRIVEATLSPDREHLTIELQNNGSALVADLPAMDVIVQYNAATDWITALLTWAPESVLPGQWRMKSLSPDLLDPDLWNPGETMMIEAWLPRRAVSAGQGAVVIAAPNGVTASAYIQEEG